MAEKKKLSEVLKDLGESSSLHGIPKIISSRQMVVKVLWCLLLLGAIALAIFTMVGLFQEFYSWPVKTSVSLNYEKLPFPAITICNCNPIRLSKLPEDAVMHNILLDKLHSESGSGSQSSPWDAIDSFFDDTYEALENETSEDYGDYDDPQTRDAFEAWRERVLASYKELPRATRANLGHQLDDMLHQFTFLGYQTNIQQSQLPVVYSSLFGNCYVINLKTVSQTSGPSKGIRMILNVEQSEYIEHFVSGSGIRLSIHEPGTFAIPEKDSVVLNPGYETNIGLKMVRIERLGGNYGECTNGEGSETEQGNTYSQASCHAVCIREYVQGYCGCTPFDAPEDGINGKICDIDNQDNMACIPNVENLIYNGLIDCECYPRCKEDTYSTRITSRKWPNSNYLQHVLMSQSCSRNISSMIQNCANLTAEGMISSTNYEKYATNFVSVNIYFEDLNFEIIKEEPFYTTIQFLSSLGGAMGFYMGASLLTYVEILQLLLELVLYCKSKFSSKTNPSNSAMDLVKQ